ncbi:MAG: hypothetical protein KY455_08825 [Euryarchaeota archaeon]|nr:hypothetical protein [Euryarchaeota archaeon]
MDVCIVPGPGNAQELVDSLTRMRGARVYVAGRPADLERADLLVTPRGPSRSFSKWYEGDDLGQAVRAVHQKGTPWIALCGSALPLSSEHGAGCSGVARFSIAAMRGSNDRLFGQDKVKTSEGRELPFHFTSAPSFEAREGTEVLGTIGGEGAILRAEDLVVSAGLPLSPEAWLFLFEAAGLPLAGAKSG